MSIGARRAFRKVEPMRSGLKFPELPKAPQLKIESDREQIAEFMENLERWYSELRVILMDEFDNHAKEIDKLRLKE